MPSASSEKTSNEIGRSVIWRQHVARERRVVGHAGLAHERRVGGEALDVGLLGEPAAGSPDPRRPRRSWFAWSRGRGSSCLLSEWGGRRGAGDDPGGLEDVARARVGLGAGAPVGRARVLDEHRAQAGRAPGLDVHVRVADQPRAAERGLVEAEGLGGLQDEARGAACGSRRPARARGRCRRGGGSSSAPRRPPGPPRPAARTTASWTARERRRGSAVPLAALGWLETTASGTPRRAQQRAAPRRRPGPGRRPRAGRATRGPRSQRFRTSSLSTPSRSRKTARSALMRATRGPRRRGRSSPRCPRASRAPGGRPAGARPRPGRPRCAASAARAARRGR